MKMIKSMFICLTILLLVGCQSTYERNTDSGKIVQITLAELVEKMENNETFAVMLTQSMCGYCQEFKGLLSEYQENHGFIMYEVILDYENATPNENLEIIKPYFSDFSTTPGIFFVEDGKNKSHLKDKNGTIDKENLDSWVLANKIDKK
ncbi:hypothetical protein [Amedibacterium intestinale]|uniref:hypothetical protein n=1 Tax=Amedibacterium intestinale TaxID=2583452 RepID=UPI000E4DD530|nr:hypothetical protein [Amedibacterium intestinale]RHO26421.1 hypothetical protein DW208_11460 [Erysipelotrichaceae bacterium AM17-60]